MDAAAAVVALPVVVVPVVAREVDAVVVLPVSFPVHTLLRHVRFSDRTSRSLGGARVLIEPHRHAGVFVARGKEDLLVTKNLTPGESVYGEKRIQIPNSGAGDASGADGEAAPATTTEYRVWNPFRSKLAAGILGGMESKLSAAV